MKIRIGDLDRAQREELFNLHAMFVNPEASERTFYNLTVPVKKIDLRAVSGGDVYQLSDNQAENYRKLLSDNSTRFPAISGNSLIDGLHRISVAKLDGKTSLEVLDFGNLLDPRSSGEQFIVKILPEKKLELRR
ncbi:hypothetical protein [Burkholderia cenocepacia]|uniref:hypothetical protein n=1 Tax=Burkholderia cenocepacia TaxID=95486 RepID=UPI002238E801|nr:hypothetical protein [Burkholderia cenocepacia]MCW5156361.1 hypothetical protein [Burkholderia cenocepacia]